MAISVIPCAAAWPPVVSISTTANNIEQSYAKNISDKNIKDTRILISGYSVDYMNLFYKDALISLRLGQSFKSTERKEMENKLLEKDIMTQKRYDENNKLIYSIANKLPVETEQGDIIFSEEYIQIIIEEINKVHNRINTLLTP